MLDLRKFPTGKSLNCINGFLSITLKRKQEITTSLRNVFVKTETESNGAT